MKYAVRSILLFLFFSSAAYAASPKFAGEIWAGSEVIPGAGPVNVYWVFDAGVYHEYVYYYATDEIRPLTSGRYTVCESQGKTTYTVNVNVNVRVPAGPPKDDGTRNFILQTKVVQVPFTKADGFLSTPRGDRLMSVGSFTQFVPPVDHPASTSAGKLKTAPDLYSSCCSDCFAVHDALGISWLNGICCLGSCPDNQGSSFGGGGAGGGW